MGGWHLNHLYLGRSIWVAKDSQKEATISESSPYLVLNLRKTSVSVGDITTGRKPARGSRINLMKIRSPWTHKNDGALWRPKAQRRVKACRCKPTLLCNLHCKIGRIETEPDTFMIRLRDSVARRASTYVYKGTTRQRFRDRQQLESQTKRIRSLAFETLAIPITTRRRLLPSSKGPN